MKSLNKSGNEFHPTADFYELKLDFGDNPVNYAMRVTDKFLQIA